MLHGFTAHHRPGPRGSSFALLNGQLVCSLCKDCTMEMHEGADGRLVLGLAVYICEGCQGGYHSHCIRDRLSPAAGLPDHGLSDVSWTDLSLVECHSTCRCRDCVEDNQWGARSLVGSMLTFSNSGCSAKSATYSVLTHFHADTTSPEACFVHGCVSPGAWQHQG